MFRLTQLCSLFRLHRPEGEIAVNGSLQVARCARCGREIIRRDRGIWGGRWERVPAGLRIVWRVPDADDMTWPTQILP